MAAEESSSSRLNTAVGTGLCTAPCGHPTDRPEFFVVPHGIRRPPMGRHRFHREIQPRPLWAATSATALCRRLPLCGRSLQAQCVLVVSEDVFALAVAQVLKDIRLDGLPPGSPGTGDAEMEIGDSDDLVQVAAAVAGGHGVQLDAADQAGRQRGQFIGQFSQIEPGSGEVPHHAHAGFVGILQQYEQETAWCQPFHDA